MVKAFHVILTLALAVLAGCSKNIQTNEAVRQGVVAHLSGNKSLQISSMEVEVTAVTFKDNLAEATVSFKPKGGDAASGMQMRYTLEKKGDAWVVQKKADSGAGHGAAMPNMGGMGAVEPGGGAAGSAMPPGHPPAGAAAPAGEMPPGHPPAGAAKK